MNYDEMTISELKDHAKELGIAVGNCGKEKLIEKSKKKKLLLLFLMMTI